jgi:uncharacterized protein
MRSVFSLLFGVGMFILRPTRKRSRECKPQTPILMANWLLVLTTPGYLLLWTGVYNYALMGFLVFSFRKMAPKN